MFVFAVLLMALLINISVMLYDSGRYYKNSDTVAIGTIKNYDAQYKTDYSSSYNIVLENLENSINSFSDIKEILDNDNNLSIHDTLGLDIQNYIDDGVRYVLTDANTNKIVGTDGITSNSKLNNEKFDITLSNMYISIDEQDNELSIDEKDLSYIGAYVTGSYNYDDNITINSGDIYSKSYNLSVFYDDTISNDIDRFYSSYILEKNEKLAIFATIILVLILVGIYFANVSGKKRYDDIVIFSVIDDIYIDFIFIFTIVLIPSLVYISTIYLVDIYDSDLSAIIYTVVSFVCASSFVTLFSSLGKRIRTHKFFNSISIIVFLKFIYRQLILPISDFITISSSISTVIAPIIYFLLAFFIIFSNDTVYRLVATIILLIVIINSTRLAVGVKQLKIFKKYKHNKFAINVPFSSSFKDMMEIGDMMRQIYDDGLKAQKIKTELITNVSHDLRTPLTSIIGYVDLLSKKSDILDDETNEYVRILKEKSDRMNTMVSDLFDLAKSASGENNFVITELNVKKLIEQTLSELDDLIDEGKFIIKIDESLYINGDGDKMYRVIQNLVENAIKYSLEGTRIYIDGFVVDELIYIEFKNISNYKMNFTSEEIVQRFNRGDESRTTKGSGLGLSIAKTYTNLNNGQFNVFIDGDMFKVQMIFEK